MKSLGRQGIALGMVVLLAVTVGAEKPKDRQQDARDEGPAARLADAPASARALQNPFAGDARALAAGRKLFVRHCAECHGQDARGLGRAANLHSSAVQDVPPGVLFWAIRNGRLPKGMPAWSALPNAQIWQLVTYLNSLK